MAKRVYVKRGDVYCIEMKGEYKLFFHYLGNDRSCMGGAVIRVFSKRYDMDYVPDIKEIIKGDVMFYAHAFISDGIDAGVWYKVGHSKDFDLEKLSHIWFANVRPEIYVNEVVPRRTIWVEPVKHWKIWKYNDIWIETNRLELLVDEKVFTGRIYPYASIMNYAEYGYYKNTAVEYEVIKRVPHEYADSYVKRERLWISRLPFLYHIFTP